MKTNFMKTKKVVTAKNSQQPSFHRVKLATIINLAAKLA
jgi:hypothetical protein